MQISWTWLLTVFLTGVVCFYLDDFLQLLISGIRKGALLFQKTMIVVSQGKHKPLSDYIKEINGTAKNNFMKTAYMEMQKTFYLLEDKKGLVAANLLCLLCSSFGISLAIYFKSYLLIPVLGVGMALLPMWVVRLKSYRFTKMLHSELSVTLSSVTSTYLRTENFVKAVEENIPFMKRPLKKMFEEFLSNYNNVDKSIVNNITALSKRLDHEVFKTWCHNLLLCQKDKNHMPALNAIISSLDSEKRLFDKLRLEIYKPLSETLTLIAIMPLIFPALAMLGTEPLDFLLNTIPGQCVLSCLIITIFITIDKAIKLCNPQMKEA